MLLSRHFTKGAPSAGMTLFIIVTAGCNTSRSATLNAWAEAGIEPSVGSVGDSYDNALAETINGLFKAEVIHRRGPSRNAEAVEFATLEWVDWFNHRRLLEPAFNLWGKWTVAWIQMAEKKVWAVRHRRCRSRSAYVMIMRKSPARGQIALCAEMLIDLSVRAERARPDQD